MKKRRLQFVVLLSVTAFLTVAAFSQQQNRQQNDRNKEQQQQSRNRIVADPEGWILIGYDIDKDRYVDVYEYINIYDLERARQMSRQRPDGEQRTTRRKMPRGGQSESQWSRDKDQRSRQQQSAAGQQKYVSGTVQDTKQVSIQQKKCTFAKVKTQSGKMVTVNLGPLDKARQLDVSQGDRIEARGHVGMVNQRPVLMSQFVRANDRSIQVQMLKGSDTRRLKGTITRTATKRIHGENRPAHKLALVELETGQKVPVDLGRERDLRDEGVSVSEGEDVTLLVRSAKIGNKKILVAKQMGIDGEKIDVKWLKDLERQRSRTTRERQTSG